MTEIEQIHANPLTALGPPAWHWEIVVYLFLGGIAAGVMILSMMLGRRVPLEERSRWARWLPLIAPLLLSVGMFALWLDLERKLTAYRFFLAFRWTAPMSWGSWILLGIYPVTIMLGLGQLTKDEADKAAGWGPLRILRLGGLLGWAHSWARQRLGGLGWANLLMGIALGGYTGILLSNLGARAAWSSAIIAPLFLVSGFSTGAALMMFFPLKDGERALLRDWDLAAIAVELALIGIFLVNLVSGDQAARAAAEFFLGGKLTAVFWSLVVATGLIVPFVIEAFEARRHLRHTAVAPALLLVGGLTLRWVLLTAGQTVG